MGLRPHLVVEDFRLPVGGRHRLGGQEAAAQAGPEAGGGERSGAPHAAAGGGVLCGEAARASGLTASTTSHHLSPPLARLPMGRRGAVGRGEAGDRGMLAASPTSQPSGRGCQCARRRRGAGGEGPGDWLSSADAPPNGPPVPALPPAGHLAGVE